MLYVTEEYYNDTYKGEPVDSADFPSLAERAEEIIVEISGYRLTLPVFGDLTEENRERVKKAICAQIEYLDANPGIDTDGADFQSAGLGRFNYSKMTGTDGGAAQRILSPRAQRILYPTGFLYRGGSL